MALLKIILGFLAVQCCTCTQPRENVILVIVNQVPGPHYEAAQQLASHVTSQAEALDVGVQVYIASDEWREVSAWTYFPLLERLNNLARRNDSWFVVVGEQTEIKLAALLDVLREHDLSQPLLLCRGVSDREETIIHHYATVHPDRPVIYPDVRAGMVLTPTLVDRLAKRWTEPANRPRSEFTIDAAYEFSTFVGSSGVDPINHPAFCITNAQGCAIVLSPLKHCKGEVKTEDIHFAVKSCSRFHSERLPVIQDTWLDDATNHAIYSDVEDPVYGTVSVGVANTERGHCGKTLAIINRVAQMTDLRWLAIVDDDTLISASRLGALLSCYDHRDLVALGERYGFAATSPRGYEYLTGGAGIVLSIALVDTLSSPGVCECPRDDAPDDMFLGVCLRRLGIPLSHSSTFHQARPIDYPSALLEGEAAISFHKFWMIDPRKAYRKYLAPADSTLKTHHNNTQSHTQQSLKDRSNNSDRDEL